MIDEHATDEQETDDSFWQEMVPEDSEQEREDEEEGEDADA